MSAAEHRPPVSPDNPLREPSPLPFGLPPFGDITPEHCREALLAGMAEQRAEVAAIVGSDEPPTFDNTVVALERSGRLLSAGVERVRQPDLVGVHAAAARDRAGDRPAGGRARRRAAPRPGAVRPHRRGARRPGTTPGLDDEAVRLVERYHLDFVLAGARLDEAGRARLTELNQELSTLSTTFGQNLQLATEAAAVQVDRRRGARRAERRGDRHRRDRRRRPRARGLPAARCCCRPASRC